VFTNLYELARYLPGEEPSGKPEKTLMMRVDLSYITQGQRFNILMIETASGYA